MPNDELLTTAQVADRLAISVSTAGRLVRAGRLTPTVKVPGATGAYLFDPEAVERFAQERLATST